MIVRLASALVLLSQVLVLWLVFDLRGASAIAFAFVGHAALGLGLALGLIARARRRTGAAGPSH